MRNDPKKSSAEGRSLSPAFETRDVLAMTGIPVNYLNKFIERNSFGIGPSIREGEGRGSRRLFAREDIEGIQLVWCLFLAGLRSSVIGKVLKVLAGPPPHTSLADAAAQNVIMDYPAEIEPGVIVIRRGLGVAKRQQELKVEVRGESYSAPASDLCSVQIIPAGQILHDLGKKMDQMGTLRRG